MPEPDPVAVAVDAALTPSVAEADAEVCGHCRAPINAPSYGTASDGTPLCHTGTIPPSANPADCYRLVTVYGHDPDGTCCLARPEPPWGLLAAPEDFAGCARRCRKTGMHTLTWGECEWAPEPEPKDPEFGWWRTIEMDDGLPSIAMVGVPLLAVLPWAAHLAVEERHGMLDEAATALDPAVCFERWRQDAVARETAEQTPHSEDTRPEPPAEHWKYRHLMSEGALWPLCRASGMTPWTTRYRREVDCPACLQLLAAPPTEAPADSGNIEP